MKKCMRVCFLTLICLMMIVPAGYAHTDPPFYTLTLGSDMPDQNEETQLTIQLTGSLTGLPTIGAKIRAVLTNSQGKKLNYNLTGSKPGTYTGMISFPERGSWDMRVEIEHENELDLRHYMIHVMKPVPGYHNFLTDKSKLTMDKNSLGQMIPPRLVVEGYIFLVVILLMTVTMIKRRQQTKQRRAPIES